MREFIDDRKALDLLPIRTGIKDEVVRPDMISSTRWQRSWSRSGDAPSVIFGVGSIGVLWFLGREAAGRIAALLAAFLLAMSYHHVWFSQNARGYTELLFWT